MAQPDSALICHVTKEDFVVLSPGETREFEQIKDPAPGGKYSVQYEFSPAKYGTCCLPRTCTLDHQGIWDRAIALRLNSNPIVVPQKHEEK